ncbi:hypothetical protein FNV43_RR19394 [Rhamnella rubrinervis]|uniref:Uncharacterized protein n=1 Tax=Rhamnella rubrinervis TaxID=2594499 RepID=A0A8K0GTN4_9ROSA|nr:hypothetical protein FNV43_RR19394 [Rhamnella rubrinervis]
MPTLGNVPRRLLEDDFHLQPLVIRPMGGGHNSANEANGQVEAVNKTIKANLKAKLSSLKGAKICNAQPSCSMKRLPIFMKSYGIQKGCDYDFPYLDQHTPLRWVQLCQPLEEEEEEVLLLRDWGEGGRGLSARTKHINLSVTWPFKVLTVWKGLLNFSIAPSFAEFYSSIASKFLGWLGLELELNGVQRSSKGYIKGNAILPPQYYELIDGDRGYDKVNCSFHVTYYLIFPRLVSLA